MPTAINGSTGVSKVQAGVVTPENLVQKLTLGTAQATTSGTIVDFTGIPNWVQRVTVMLDGVSLSGSSQPRIQLGSGSVQTSGYTGATTGSGNMGALSSGFDIQGNFVSAVNIFYCVFVLTKMSGNKWMCSANYAVNGNGWGLLVGTVTLAGSIDRLRLTTVNGTDTFDAGSINILYEG